jgi:hypothetical protein
MKLNAMCNKCGWYGQAEAGSDMIEHPDCNYSATFSQTEVKLHELIESAEPLVQNYVIPDDWPDDAYTGRMLTAGQIRSLRFALLKAKGGEG